MDEQSKPNNAWYERVVAFLRAKITRKHAWYACGALLFLSALWIEVHSVPKDFPLGEAVTVETGESLQAITNMLYEQHVIRYPAVFRTTVILLGGERQVKAGDYLLDKREGPLDLAYRFVRGDYHLVVVKVTIPEGWNTSEIADYFSKTLINFDRAGFLKLAKPEEGYLFPDTYFVSPAVKLPELIRRMKDNFDVKWKNVPGAATTSKPLADIITVASILEEEARTTEDRRIVSGIIWKRLSLGMPLQVDSTLSYVTGRNTYELTNADLSLDSPYNTYKYKGLPPAPISDPGTDAIFAALNPVSSKYLYFLSSKSGTMHYASTLAQHEKNIELYLNK
jgi:UPF0755 protein